LLRDASPHGLTTVIQFISQSSANLSLRLRHITYTLPARSAVLCLLAARCHTVSLLMDIFNPFNSFRYISPLLSCRRPRRNCLHVPFCTFKCFSSVCFEYLCVLIARGADLGIACSEFPLTLKSGSQLFVSFFGWVEHSRQGVFGSEFCTSPARILISQFVLLLGPGMFQVVRHPYHRPFNLQPFVLLGLSLDVSPSSSG
jgi:hypothetical protein